jgi:hypothetical protein
MKKTIKQQLQEVNTRIQRLKKLKEKLDIERLQVEIGSELHKEIKQSLIIVRKNLTELQLKKIFLESKVK